MVNVKFEKTDTAVFLSHIDVQRGLNRVFKRAGLSPKRSEGFHPHILLKLSAPIPLGVLSRAEYFTLEIDGVTAAEMLAACNRVTPPGIRFLSAWETKEAPNFAGKMAAADYLIQTNALLPYRYDLLSDIQKEFIVDSKNKGVVTQKDASSLILGLAIGEENAVVRLAAGNVTLRIDRFLEGLNQKLGLAVPLSAAQKTDAYFPHPKNGYANVDAVLDAMGARVGKL